MKKYKFKIKNLDCPNCAQQLEEAIQKEGFIKNVNINFITQKLTFECLEENKEQALKNIQKIIKKQEPDIILEENTRL